MQLTAQQKATLKSFILADPVLGPKTSGPGTDYAFIANALSSPAAPSYYVWRTSVSRREIYDGNPQPENSFWSWTFYKNQAVTEQGAWVQMFMGDQADFSKANIRTGIAQIFTSAAVVNATHAFAVGRRLANALEKLFATGAGSLAAPSVMTVEGSIDTLEIGGVLA